MQIKIKTEQLPQRCEICHQTDCFDASSNSCTRCAGVSIVAPSKYSVNREYLDAVNEAWTVRMAGLSSIVISIAALSMGSMARLSIRVAIFAFISSIGAIIKGVRILKVLRKEGESDPDWQITSHRTKTGLIGASVGLLLALIWLFLLILGFYGNEIPEY